MQVFGFFQSKKSVFPNENFCTNIFVQKKIQQWFSIVVSSEWTRLIQACRQEQNCVKKYSFSIWYEFPPSTFREYFHIINSRVISIFEFASAAFYNPTLQTPQFFPFAMIASWKYTKPCFAWNYKRLHRIGVSRPLSTSAVPQSIVLNTYPVHQPAHYHPPSQVFRCINKHVPCSIKRPITKCTRTHFWWYCVFHLCIFLRLALWC